MRKGHCRHSCKQPAKDLQCGKKPLVAEKTQRDSGPGAKEPKRGDIPGKDGPPLLSQLEKQCYNGVQASWLLSTWEWSGMRKGRLRISETSREWVSFTLSCSRFERVRLFLFFIYTFWKTTTRKGFLKTHFTLIILHISKLNGMFIEN